MPQALMLRSDAAPYINGQATTAGVDTSGNSDQLLISNGAVGAAGIAFSSDPDSGMYRIGANNIGIAVNGAKVLDVATTGLSVTGTLGSSGALTVTAGGIEITAGGLQIDSGTRTATASGTGGTSTVTLSKYSGVITTDAITTAAGATHVITVTNTLVTAASIILATCNGTTSAGTPVVTGCVAGSGSFTITIQNIHAAAAVNAALKVNFVVLR